MKEYRLVLGDTDTGLRQMINFDARDDMAAMQRFTVNRRGDWGQLWKGGQLLAARGDAPDDKAKPTGTGWRGASDEQQAATEDDD